MSINGPERVGFVVRRQGTPIIRLVLISLIIVFALLAILPITQWLSADRGRNIIRSVDTISQPPPEAPPPEPPPPEEEEEQEEEPEMEDTPPPQSLEQLESALNPGIGDAVGKMAGIGDWGVMPDVMDDLDIFSIADLDQRPRRLRTIMPEYPVELQQQRVTGTVRLQVLIDEQGNVTVEKVLSGPHRTLEQNARQAVSRWRFEPPRKDGKPVRARYIQPIPFDL
jgi:protein TonB